MTTKCLNDVGLKRFPIGGEPTRIFKQRCRVDPHDVERKHVPRLIGKRCEGNRCGAHIADPQPSPPQQHFQCLRSEEHTSELQSLMRISYAVFCLKKKKKNKKNKIIINNI